MELVELASALGSPARLGVRILLLPLYLIEDLAVIFHSSIHTKFARCRFGPSYRWRWWLSYDVRRLEALEKLINTGNDDEILRLRDARLEALRLIALVGALLASVAVQALGLPRLNETHYTARAMFVVALSLSVLATFFTCIQQREFGAARDARSLRAWLSNGERYVDFEGREVYQSSLAAHHLLEAPYEILTLSVAILLGGLASYLGSAWVNHIGLGNDESDGRRLDAVAVMTAFGVATVFSILIFNVLLGGKNLESRKTSDGLFGLDRQSKVAERNPGNDAVTLTEHVRLRTC